RLLNYKYFQNLTVSSTNRFDHYGFLIDNIHSSFLTYLSFLKRLKNLVLDKNRDVVLQELLLRLPHPRYEHLTKRHFHRSENHSTIVLAVNPLFYEFLILFKYK